MAKKIAPTDALEILHRRHYAGQPVRLVALNQVRANDSVARQLVALRTEANLAQRALAALIGTTASVICRLEDADYEGLDLATIFKRALNIVGHERLLFGTNSSFFPRGWNAEIFTSQVNALTQIGMSHEQAVAIFGGNMKRLLFGDSH